jgi:uroporphyrinogen-III synthase
LGSSGQSRALDGRGIVVTRPREQSAGLAARIEAAGGRVLLYPAMEIDDIADMAELDRLIRRLDEFDLAIFVSPTAVQKALARVRATRPWPPALAVAAVGRASRAELAREGIGGALAPESGADSEALLALPALANVAGRRVVVFRGEGGRELLGDTLAARGARVEYAECYRRAAPRQDVAPLLDAWDRGAIQAVTSSSSAGLANLDAVLGPAGRARFRGTPLFVSHPRIAEAARQLGVRQVQACGPGDDEMVAALVAYFQGP